MVLGAVKHYNDHGTHENIPRKKRSRKTNKRTDKLIVRLAEKNPFMTSVQIKKEPLPGITISSRTIRRCLEEAQLYGRVNRKKPLLKKKNRQARLKFAREHINRSINDWKKVLWSDETKVNRVGSNGRVYVRRLKCKENDPKYTMSSLKHGEENIKLWGCFSWYRVAPIVKIDGILDQEKYKDILQNHMVLFADENLPVTWVFQQDNDPNHTAKSVKK